MKKIFDLEQFVMCCRFSRRCGIPQNSSVCKWVGVFFVVRHRSKRKVETRSLEAFVLACKKLSLFEQVFVMEKFCLNVAEIANCSNPGLEIKTITTFFSNV